MSRIRSKVAESGIWHEFVEFVQRGNVIDLGVVCELLSVAFIVVFSSLHLCADLACIYLFCCKQQR